jgi:hypothetical protein
VPLTLRAYDWWSLFCSKSNETMRGSLKAACVFPPKSVPRLHFPARPLMDTQIPLADNWGLHRNPFRDSKPEPFNRIGPCRLWPSSCIIFLCGISLG